MLRAGSPAVFGPSPSGAERCWGQAGAGWAPAGTAWERLLPPSKKQLCLGQPVHVLLPWAPLGSRPHFFLFFLFFFSPRPAATIARNLCCKQGPRPCCNCLALVAGPAGRARLCQRACFEGEMQKPDAELPFLIPAPPGTPRAPPDTPGTLSITPPQPPSLLLAHTPPLTPLQAAGAIIRLEPLIRCAEAVRIKTVQG